MASASLRPNPPPPGSATSPDDSGDSRDIAELFPAEVVVVHTPQELREAFTRSDRDIEIRAHLDLRGLPLITDPSVYTQAESEWPFTPPSAAAPVPGTDLAFVSWPTRSIRGNCLHASSWSTDAKPGDGAGEEWVLQTLLAELQGDPVSLKPFQCLLLTNANIFFLKWGNAFWLDNLFFGITQPRPQSYDLSAAVLATGTRTHSRLPSGVTWYEKPMNVFATNITVHGHGQEAFSTRVISLIPNRSQTSVLFQDCIFVNLVGRDPPFLIASGTYATFRNCLFRTVTLPRSEIFDVSLFGTVTLQRCYFSDVSTFNGLVDTTYNDYVPIDDDYSREYLKHTIRGSITGSDDHAAYDIALSPAPPDAATLYDAQYVVVNETLSDCLAAQFSRGFYVLPGCHELSVDERRANYQRTKYGDAHSPTGAVVSDYSHSIGNHDQSAYEDFKHDQDIKRQIPFYDQYYNYMGDDYVAWDTTTYPYGAPAPMAAWRYAAYYQYAYVPIDNIPGTMFLTVSEQQLVPTLGESLSTEHPWFVAINTMLPPRPLPPAGAAATCAFHNGLPLATSYGAPPPGLSPAISPYSSDVPAGGLRASQTGAVNVPVWVMTVLPAVTALLLLSFAVTVSAFRYRRQLLAKAEYREGKPCRLPMPGQGLSTAGAAGTSHSLLAPQEKALMAPWQPRTARMQPGSALNPLFEYQLPAGLGLDLAAHTSTAGAEHVTARPTCAAHTARPSNGHSNAGVTNPPISQTSLHSQLTGTAANAHLGRSHKVGGSVMALSYVPLPSTQAPRLDVGTSGTDVACVTHRRLRKVLQQLDSFSGHDRLIGRFQVLGPRQRRHGGQAVVQFVRDVRDGLEYAAKFFLHVEAFRAEAAFYAASFPALYKPPLITPCTHGQAVTSTTPSAPPRLNACTSEQHLDLTVGVKWPRSLSVGLGGNRSSSSSNRSWSTAQCRTTPRGRADMQASCCFSHDASNDRSGEGWSLKPVHAAHQLHEQQHRGRAADLSCCKAPVTTACDSTCATSSSAFTPPSHRDTPPSLRPHTALTPGQPPAAASSGVSSANSGDASSSQTARRPAARMNTKFLPLVEAVCDNAVDPQGRPLPPCIIMEMGESLQDWSNRAEPDFLTSLSVLSNVAARMALMHENGYVHRDLKPANVIWLPRENRWTVIDFGCVAHIGEVVPLSFTLAYAPPEVVEAYEAGTAQLQASAAQDAWSLGVMAFELLSGSPAFKFLTDGRAQVLAQLRGEVPLPWEDEQTPLTSIMSRQLGAFRAPVLQLLRRIPSERISMQRFHMLCGDVVSGSTTVE